MNHGWYVLLATGSLVLAFAVGSVVGPVLVQDLTPKYQVVFSQTPTTACGGPLYGMPWAVTLGGRTITKGGGDLPTSGEFGYTLQYVAPNLINLTRIAFSVPNGSYNYTLVPAGDFADQYSLPQGAAGGTIRVEGHDLMINVTVEDPLTCYF